MAISVTNLTAGIGTSDPQSTASVAPTSGAVLILTVTVSASTAGGVEDALAVSGLSGTWTQRSTYAWASRRRTWLFTCANWTGSGTISLNPTVTDFQEIGWVLDQATGLDATTPFGTFVSGGGGTGTSTTRTLTASGVPDTGDATYSSLSLESNVNMNPEAGWTALGQTTTGSLGVRRVESAWDADADTTCTWSWNGTGQGNGGFIVILNVGAASTNASAIEATATATAQPAVMNVGPVAGDASSTATAHQAGTSASQGAGEAQTTATAHDASVNVAPNAGEAQATAAAHTASAGPSVEGFAATATATAAGQQPAASIAPNAGSASATATANNAVASTSTGGTTYTDDFTRANANSIGGSWDSVSGTGAIRSNAFYNGDDTGGGAGTLQRHRHQTALPSDDMFTEITVNGFATGGYSDARLMVRWSTDTSFYELRIDTNGDAILNRVTSGGEESSHHTFETGMTYSFPETWKLTVSGTTTVALEAFRNGVSVGTFSDTDGSRIQTGAKGGIGAYTSGGTGAVTIDDYSHGELSGGGSPIDADAGDAAATAAAHNASASVSEPASPVGATAEAAATAHNAGVSVSTPAGSAAATATAWEAGVGNNFSDTFDRADANSLGSDWTARSGTGAIRTNRFYNGDDTGGGAGTLQRHQHNGVLASTEMATQATIVGFPTGGYSDARIMARYSSATSCYEFRVTAAGAWALNRVTGSGETDLTSGTGLTLSLPETWKLVVLGTSTVHIFVYRNGTLLTDYEDSSASRITTGAQGGIGSFTSGGTGAITLDDYSHFIADEQLGLAEEATATATAHFDTSGGSISLTLTSDNPIPVYATAHDTTVSIGADSGVTAGEAAATAEAHNPAVAIGASAAVAEATATAQQPGTSASIGAGVAEATATAHQADDRVVINFVAIARVAEVTATAHNAAMVPSSFYTPTDATVAAAAHDPSVNVAMTITPDADQPPLRNYEALEPMSNYEALAPVLSP